MGKRDRGADSPRARTPKATRLGFMKGQGLVPDDFNRIGAEEIEALFERKPDRSAR